MAFEPGEAALLEDLSFDQRRIERERLSDAVTVSYTHLRAHETVLDLVCRLLLEKKPKLCTIHINSVTNERHKYNIHFYTKDTPTDQITTKSTHYK